MLDGIVDVLANIGEGNDLVALGGDLVGHEAQQRRGKIDIRKAGVFGVEA